MTVYLSNYTLSVYSMQSFSFFNFADIDLSLSFSHPFSPSSSLSLSLSFHLAIHFSLSLYLSFFNLVHGSSIFLIFLHLSITVWPIQLLGHSSLQVNLTFWWIYFIIQPVRGFYRNILIFNLFAFVFLIINMLTNGLIGSLYYTFCIILLSFSLLSLLAILSLSFLPLPLRLFSHDRFSCKGCTEDITITQWCHSPLLCSYCYPCLCIFDCIVHGVHAHSDVSWWSDLSDKLCDLERRSLGSCSKYCTLSPSY